MLITVFKHIAQGVPSGRNVSRDEGDNQSQVFKSLLSGWEEYSWWVDDFKCEATQLHISEVTRRVSSNL